MFDAPQPMRIDAHQHFWRYTPDEFDWLDDSMAAQRRDFLPADLSPQLSAIGIDGTVAVQARMSLAETDWLLELQRRNPAFMRGVVGWVPLSDPAKAAVALENYRGNPAFKGVRHVVQGQPPGFLDARGFNDGVREVTARQLTYDILIYAHQLEEASRFADRHPNQTFILDHIAKPVIAAGAPPPPEWATQIKELARRENVSCKFSALTTEVRAPGHAWTPALLRPYFDIALNAFGPDRLMFGSDWPVCLAGTGYARWHGFVSDCAGELGARERAAIFGGTAARIYKL